MSNPIEQLRDLAAQYARCVDRREFDKVPECMASDARIAVHMNGVETDAPAHVMSGISQIKQAFELLRHYERTFHLVGQQLITHLAADEARGETVCVAYHFHSKNGVNHAYVMYIRYQDHFVRSEGHWKIAERRLIVERTEGENVDALK